MVLEEYGFQSFLAMPAQPLSLLEWQAQQPSLLANSAGIGVVVDAGARSVSGMQSLKQRPCCSTNKNSSLLLSELENWQAIYSSLLFCPPGILSSDALSSLFSSAKATVSWHDQSLSLS